jgi:hypothetical protein
MHGYRLFLNKRLYTTINSHAYPPASFQFLLTIDTIAGAIPNATQKSILGLSESSRGSMIASRFKVEGPN